jgi:hypothetical protein
MAMQATASNERVVPQSRLVPVMVTSEPTAPVWGVIVAMVGGGQADGGGCTVMLAACASVR